MQRQGLHFFFAQDFRKTPPLLAQRLALRLQLFPSLPGLLHLLKAVGFARTEVLQPIPDAYEQIASGKRVIVAAYN